MPGKRLLEVIQAVEAAAGADIIFYSGPIVEEGVDECIEAVLDDRRHDQAILLLRTYGGDPNAAYRIARIFQKTFSSWSVFPYRYCMSAGTLICLGANEIIFGPLSQLGPLDVQILKPNEIMARKSGLLPKATFQALTTASYETFERFMLGITVQSLGQVSFKVAAEISGNVTSALFAPLFGSIDPDMVGSDQRDLEVATEYGSRLAAISKNITERNIAKLVNGYPSHGFVIDDNEICELFTEARAAGIEELQLGHICERLVEDESALAVVSLSKLARQIKEQNNAEGSGDEAAESEVGEVEKDGASDGVAVGGADIEDYSDNQTPPEGQQLAD